jgi:dihydropteroate synthase
MTIVFPLPIAPFHVLILPINIRIDLLKETAEQLYQALLKETLYYVYDHALDDRRKKESILFDPKGCFKILVDRKNKKLVAMHYIPGKKDPEILIKGKTAKEIARTAIDLHLISKLDHAIYLGSELEKAEIALKIGRGYVQDNPLWAA